MAVLALRVRFCAMCRWEQQMSFYLLWLLLPLPNDGVRVDGVEGVGGRDFV